MWRADVAGVRLRMDTIHCDGRHLCCPHVHPRPAVSPWGTEESAARPLGNGGGGATLRPCRQLAYLGRISPSLTVRLEMSTW